MDNKHLYDFDEFVQCVQRAGNAICLTEENFLQWESKMSHRKLSQETRPKIDDVAIAKFCR